MSTETRKSKIATPLTTYWDRSQWPLQSLVFLLPMLIAYEIGSVLTAASGDPRLPKILAESWLGDFFLKFGVTGYYLPLLIVVAVLVCWHLTRRDPWLFEPRLYLFMAGESLMLAIPLFVFMLVLFQNPAMQGLAQAVVGESAKTWQSGIVHALGAGIYEELMFRLIAIALLHLLLVDLLALPEHVGASAAVIISALGFAAYHFPSLSAIQNDAGRFLFYTLAGIYFAAVYVLRGFGVAAATHAAYDIFIVAIELLQHRTG